jgi:hypothetical protein
MVLLGIDWGTTWELDKYIRNIIFYLGSIHIEVFICYVPIKEVNDHLPHSPPPKKL